MLRSAVLVMALLAPIAARAADLPVSYLVEEKPLKAAIAGTTLSFELYSDNICTTLVQSIPVNVEDVTILSKLKQMTPKGDTKLANTVELRTTLSSPAPASARYLHVAGSGIVPIGGACQAQGPSTAPVPVLMDATGAVIGTLDSTACGNSSAVFNSSAGVVSVGVYRTHAAFSNCGIPLFFASTDCSGAPYTLDMPTIASELIGSAIGVNNKIYIPATSGATSTPYNSKLISVLLASNCANPGQTFIPPHACCCTAPTCPASTDNIAPVQETLSYTPPFSAVLR